MRVLIDVSEDYLPLHGDPDSNGKKDKKMIKHGQEVVLIHEPKIWSEYKRKIQSRQRFRDEKGEDMDDADQAMMNDRFNSMGAKLMGKKLPSMQRCHGGGDGEEDADGEKKAKKDKPKQDDDDEAEEFYKKNSSAAAEELEEKTPQKAAASAAKTAASSVASEAKTPKAKGKAKAKVKTQQASQDKDNKKAVGQRGARDGKEMSCAALRGFSKSDTSSVKYFGPEWKNATRNWNGYIAKLADLIEDSEVDSDIEELNVILRSLKSARNAVFVCVVMLRVIECCA